MVLSFHPCFEADTNIICAGREPDEKDLAAIRAADAVVLPQGCREALYRIARENCCHVFPDYDARFQHPGKTGQAHLFCRLDLPHPRTWIYDDTDHFRQSRRTIFTAGFPLVFKLDWGGEGDTVSLLHNSSDLDRALEKAATFELTGQRGFILQTVVPHHRTLRVAVIGQILKAYWRVQKDSFVFGSSVSKGAHIDADSDPDLQKLAMSQVRRFCQKTRINLAGIDLIFDESGRQNKQTQPQFLEINYFFGRTGLGGSERFYAMLQSEISRWLASLDMAVTTQSMVTDVKKGDEIAKRPISDDIIQEGS